MPPDTPAAAETLRTMLTPASTMLFVIDVQVDFAAPGGAMDTVGCDLSDVEPVIDKIETLTAAARAAGVTVGFARVVTRPETDSKALKRLYARKGYPDDAVAICRAGAPGADYYRVRPSPGDLQIEKPMFSSFVGTDLDDQLKSRDIDTLVFVGLTTDCCVDCTVRDAFHRDYDCFIVSDACSAYGEALHQSALTGLSKNCAMIVQSDDVLAAWRLAVAA